MIPEGTTVKVIDDPYVPYAGKVGAVLRRLRDDLYLVEFIPGRRDLYLERELSVLP
jgi:hypothetical protein